MTDADLLVMLKSNLEIYPENTTQDLFLTQLVNVAKAEIAREGITLEDTISDDNLVVMYAAYLFRKRASDGVGTSYSTTATMAVGMPRMLRYALNNRLFSQKMKEAAT